MPGNTKGPQMGLAAGLGAADGRTGELQGDVQGVLDEVGAGMGRHLSGTLRASVNSHVAPPTSKSGGRRCIWTRLLARVDPLAAHSSDAGGLSRAAERSHGSPTRV